MHISELSEIQYCTPPASLVVPFLFRCATVCRPTFLVYLKNFENRLRFDKLERVERWEHFETQYTGWLRIKYPTRQYAISATSRLILKILEAA